MIEGFHIITLQGEQGLRGVHMNLEVEEKTHGSLANDRNQG